MFCVTVSKLEQEATQFVVLLDEHPRKSPVPTIACFHPPPLWYMVFRNSGEKRWRH
jgi:hypothetical protein